MAIFTSHGTTRRLKSTRHAEACATKCSGDAVTKVRKNVSRLELVSCGNFAADAERHELYK